MSIDLAQLAEPFDPDEIEFRVGATNKEKTKALALAYITSRSVMDRLDDVCKPENWEDAYQPGPNGGVLCGISIRVKDRWVTKWDGADNTKIEGIKGGLTDAFKRAAVKWGIGRYLYGLPNIWVDAKQQGQDVKIDENVARHKMFGNAPKQSPKPEVNQNTGEVLTPVQAAGFETNGNLTTKPAEKEFTFPSNAAKDFFKTIEKVTNNFWQGNGWHFSKTMEKLNLNWSFLNSQNDMKKARQQLKQHASNRRDEKAAAKEK